VGHFQPAKGDEDAPDVDEDSGDGDERDNGKEIEKTRGVAEGDGSQSLGECALSTGCTSKQVANEAKEEPVADQAERGGCQRKQAETDAVVAAVGEEERPAVAQCAFYLEQCFAARSSLPQGLQHSVQKGVRWRQRGGQEEAADKLGDGDEDTDTGAQEESLNPGIVVIDHFYEWVGFQKEGLPYEPRIVLWL